MITTQISLKDSRYFLLLHSNLNYSQAVSTLFFPVVPQVLAIFLYITRWRACGRITTGYSNVDFLSLQRKNYFFKISLLFSQNIIRTQEFCTSVTICCSPSQNAILEKEHRLLPTEDSQDAANGEGFNGTCAL